MKLSCIPVSYFAPIISGEMNIGSWASEAASLGMDGIDLSILFFQEPEQREPAHLRSIRKEIERCGVKLAIVNTYSYLAHPDADERQSQIEQLKKDIGVAALLGAEHVRVVTGQAHPRTKKSEGIQWALDGFLQAAVVAVEAGVELVYENHSKPGNWDYPDFSLDTEIFFHIAGELEDTPVKLLFDTANPLVFGEEPLPVLKQVGERVTCVHAADTRVTGALEPVVIGTGLVPFKSIFSYLKKSAFQGWVSIEEASGTGAAGVKSAVDFVRRTWEECDL